MAEAILRGVIGSGSLPADAVIASDPLPERRKRLTDEIGVSCVAGNLAPARCPRVLLAVKPQVMGEVLDNIASTVGADALVVSIAAGISTGFIDRHLGGRGRIVRVMPNTPMLVGEGMSAIAPGPRATGEDVGWTAQLFGAGGRTVTVTGEMMDAVTAVSGSGPAYFFYLIEAMIAAGVAEGLEPETAALLAGQTCAGAAKLLMDSHEPPDVLRARVTSPGGTTQRAIEAMESARVKESLISAIRAAAERSRELGK